MRRPVNTLSIAAISVISLTALATYSANAQSAAQEHAPCQQIKAACEQAGFQKGGARDGTGLQVDCIRPLMQGVPQRAKAARPLPTVDPAVVTACKEKNAKFGEPKEAGAKQPPQPGASSQMSSPQAAPAPAAPPPASGQMQ